MWHALMGLREQLVVSLRSLKSRAARRWRAMRTRGRWSTTVEGYAIDVQTVIVNHPTAPLCAVCEGCSECSRIARRSIDLRLRRMAVPAIRVPLCRCCAQRIRRAERLEGALAIGLVALGILAGFALTGLWPWAPFLVVIGVVAAANGLGFLIRWVVDFRGGVDGWLGVPARWRRTRSGVLRLEAPSRVVRKLMIEMGVPQENAALAHVREHHVLVARLALPASVCLGVGIVWITSHPDVRIMNFGLSPVVVHVDGRLIARVDGVPGEVSNAGQRVRVPWGWHRFETRDESGERIDQTQAFVGNGLPMLYAPVLANQCFWLEQRVYGRAGRLAGTVTPLDSSRRFIVLPVEPDSWFQGNPAEVSQQRWLSGGSRTTVRHGDCSVLESGGVAR